MLSLDITDKQIRLARGSLAGSTIRIDDVDTRDVPDGSVVNGYIADIPMVSGEIIDMLSQKGITEKEVIVCINSSAVIYKELEVPRPKSLKNHAAIEAMVLSQIGVGIDYAATYSIVKEYQGEDGAPKLKILANACPQKLIEGYERLFNQLGLKARHLNLSNNCITRLVMASDELRNLSPLLCVQVESESINMNLYEDGALTLSRYVKVDPQEYAGNADFMNVAVFDNLFRTLQFIGQRPNAQPLKQIVFYGAIEDFATLANTISSFNIPAALMETPENVEKNCEFEFSYFANAVGAFNRFDPLFDHVDLHTSNIAKSKIGKNSQFFVKLGGVTLGCVVVVVGSWGVFKYLNDNIRKEITQIGEEIKLKDQRITILRGKIDVYDNLIQYRNSVMAAQILFDFQPQDIGQIKGKLTEVIAQTIADYTKAEKPRKKPTLKLTSLEIAGYTVKAEFTTSYNGIPSFMYDEFIKQGFFAGANYTGFTAVEPESNAPAPTSDDETEVTAPKTAGYTFNVELRLKGGHAYELK